MKPLSSMDASWFHGESQAMPFHVANLHLFDQPSGRKVDLLAELRRLVSERAPYLPLLHRKLDARSLRLGNPVWVDEPELDLDYHVQRVQLAAPGGQQQLNELVVQLHQPLLDRNRPLWQLVLIEGLADGGFALYMKLHHGAVDGGSASMVVDGLFSGEPVAQGGADGSALAPQREPQLAELLWRTTMDLWVETPRKVAGALREMSQLDTAGAKDGERFGVRDMLELAKPAPRTPFNIGLTPERTWGSASLSLSEVKAFGKARDATINDVVLAVITGALRRHLDEQGRLTREPLVAGIPVSVRADGDTAHNNQVSLMLARLPVNEDDPQTWMPIVRRSIGAAKRLQEAARPIARLQVELPSLRLPGVNNLGSMMEGLKAAEDLHLHHQLPPFANLWVSNVPGPRKPLVFAGQAAKTFIPVALVMHGTALNVTVISYLDRMDFGVLASPQAVPEAQQLADLLVTEFETLKQTLQ